LPRYRTIIHSAWDPDRALAYMADFSNASSWDPSVVRASPAAGDDVPAGTVFDLVVMTGGRELPLRYQVIDKTDRAVTLRARTSRLESIDTISVAADPGGSLVTYDAWLGLRGVARVFNPLLGPAFRRIGERARASLAVILANAQ